MLPEPIKHMYTQDTLQLHHETKSDRFGHMFVRIDKGSSYIPVISTITGLAGLVGKAGLAIIQATNRRMSLNLLENPYFRHIQNKSIGRCFLELIPGIGNMILGIYEGIKSAKHNRLIKNLKEGSDIQKLYNLYNDNQNKVTDSELINLVKTNESFRRMYIRISRRYVVLENYLTPEDVAWLNAHKEELSPNEQLTLERMTNNINSRKPTS